MSVLEPIPVGTVVDYHGSCTHGRYVITTHEQPRPGIPDPDVHYPDGVAYVIWDAKIPPHLRRFGMREWAVHQVRRTSLTVVP